LNIYSQKQRWKLLLFAAALVIIGLSLWYTNTLVNKIANDERKNVKLWADAIRKKAKLVQYTNELFTKITSEERKKVELWADGTKQLANPSLQMEDVSFIFEVIKNNETVPVILSDANGNIISSRNLDSSKTNDKEYLKQQMEIMRSQHAPIEITILKGQKNYLYYKDSKLFSELKNVLDDLVKSFISEVAINSASVPVIFTDSTRKNIIAVGNIYSTKVASPELLQETIAEMESSKPPIMVDFGDEGKQYIFYRDSFLLTQLKYYPYVQFSVIGLFLVIAYTLFSTARNAEQNQVWVGLAKETAHQLGTPLSSLMAWVEYLKTKNVPAETITELEKDVKRLETITERFSKIGSAPKLEKENIYLVMEDAVNYLKTRTSKNVSYTIKPHDGNQVMAKLNIALFAWVIENICRNAVDAMNGNGSITVDIYDQTQFVYIDITDTGKGLPKSQYKTIFKPGFTTKQRGWGLGLSLSKRIIENYHEGEIFVKTSEPNKGTTFRIVLNK
jgi:signal transduction histidine kinase